MGAERLREAAKVLRERAEAATGVWGVGEWQVSLSEFKDEGHRDEYRRLPAWMQNHVATNDVHGSVIVTSPWQDTGPVTYIATMHPGVGLALADWLWREAYVAGVTCRDVAREAADLADAILGGAS